MKTSMSVSILMALSTHCAVSACSDSVLSAGKLAEVGMYLADADPAFSRRTIHVSVVQTDQMSCYKTLRVVAAQQGALPIVKTFYLAPDERTLAAQVFDLLKSPRAAARDREHQLLRSVANPSNPSIGQKDAPVTIGIFADFQCPYCKTTADILIKEVLPAEGNNIRIVFNQLPLPMHPWAREAAEITSCIAELGSEHFWAAHDWLFTHQRDLEAETFHEVFFNFLATQRLDSVRINACLAEGRGAAVVDRDLLVAAENNVQSTPTIFVNGFRALGVQNAEHMRTLIRQAMLRGVL